MGQNIGVILGPPQEFLTLKVTGNEHGGGQLGTVDLLLIDEAVPHIGHIVRRHHADMTCAVTRQLQNTEAHTAEVEKVVLRADDGIGNEALLQKELSALAVGQRHIIGPVGIRVDGDTRFDDMSGGLCAAALLQIADVSAVVKMRVAANNAPQMKAAVLDQRRQSGPVQFGIAGVDQNDIRIRDAIDGQQRRGRLRHPGASQNMP